MGKWLGFLVLAAVWVGPAEAQAGDSPSVRGTHPELAGAITDAAEQSPTFRQLVAAIRSAGGLVYVHHGTCGRNVRACLLLNITQAGPSSPAEHPDGPAEEGPRPDDRHRPRAAARAGGAERAERGGRRLDPHLLRTHRARRSG